MTDWLNNLKEQFIPLTQKLINACQIISVKNLIIKSNNRLHNYSIQK